MNATAAGTHVTDAGAAYRTQPVGILALQGAVAPHAEALSVLGVAHRRVLHAHDLDGLRGLILPGGESTAQRRVMNTDGGALEVAIRRFAASGHPVLATCAGLVLAAQWGLIGADITRNGWGRQVASFEARADDGETPLVCIRAPRIRQVRPPTRVVLTLDGEPVRLRQGSTVATIDHPELTGDRRLHAQLFGP